jgi:hypothetical protein
MNPDVLSNIGTFCDIDGRRALHQKPNRLHCDAEALENIHRNMKITRLLLRSANDGGRVLWTVQLNKRLTYHIFANLTRSTHPAKTSVSYEYKHGTWERRAHLQIACGEFDGVYENASINLDMPLECGGYWVTATFHAGKWVIREFICERLTQADRVTLSRLGYAFET